MEPLKIVQYPTDRPPTGPTPPKTTRAHLQGLAKEWSLGCVKRAPRPEEASMLESGNLGTIL